MCVYVCVCGHLQLYCLVTVIICHDYLLTLNTGVRDVSGFELTYVDIPRKYDAGVMTIGHTVNFMQIVPPHQDNFDIYGVCDSSCTSQVSIVYCVIYYTYTLNSR